MTNGAESISKILNYGLLIFGQISSSTFLGKSTPGKPTGRSGIKKISRGQVKVLTRLPMFNLLRSDIGDHLFVSSEYNS